MKNSTRKNLQQLRSLMGEHQLDAYIVPAADPHQTEYACPYWKCREWISGFTGSAGSAAVLRKTAGLWTDGRYFIQAEQELQDSGMDLFRMAMPDVPTLIDWVCENVDENGVVGIDGRQLTAAQATEWEKKLEKKKIRLVTDCDLIDTLWTDRPPAPDAPVALHGIEYTGSSTVEKLTEIRKAMTEKDADYYLVSSLYDIAWLFNIRGGDIPHCPVVMAYALVSAEEARLFVDEAKLSDAVRAELEASGVTVASYTAIADALKELPIKQTIFLDANRVNAFLRQCVPAECKVVEGKDLTDLPKGLKNSVQLENWSKVQQWDGVAMVRFWKWIEEQLPQGGLTECVAADRLEAFRRSHSECVDLSFTSISAYGPNAAMMHYSPVPETCATLRPEGLYLIDSGGQYPGGTTDITRTFALGDCSDEQRLDYTLVLKGVIGLTCARFLKGASGTSLDILARQPLWDRGGDYKCGTGHGVGYFLNVHEGPQSFSQGKGSITPLEPGMVITIEPGVYKEDRHGIRIENMVSVEEDRETECGTFYRFDTMTLCPIDTRPLKTDLMTAREIAWLNAYHQMVLEKLSPHLTTEEVRWLESKTLPIASM